MRLRSFGYRTNEGNLEAAIAPMIEANRSQTVYSGHRE